MFPIRDTIPARHAPVMTVLLILINSLIFILELTLPPEQLHSLITRFGLIPSKFEFGQGLSWKSLSFASYFPFISCLFLHGGWAHVISNMWFLWLFGDNIEDRMGPVRFLVFYLLCGILASLTHLFINPQSSVPIVGASGALAGVMGAYIVLYPKSTIITLVPVFFYPVFLEIPALIYLGLWFIIQIYSGTVGLSQVGYPGGIAFWAHVGGFMAGIFLHFLFLASKRFRKRKGDQ